MGRFYPTDYSQTILVDICLDKQLLPGTLERTIHELVESIDLSIFDKRFKNSKLGAPAYPPQVLLKIVLLGYSRGILSSRKLERACRENMTFRAISSNLCPDHSTIAAFVSSMFEEILYIFCEVVYVCDQMNLIGGDHFSLDGVKISSNASKEWSGTHDELRSKVDKFKATIAYLEGLDLSNWDKEELLRHQEAIKKLREKVSKVETFLANSTPRLGSSGNEVKSNITDNESAMMKTSHGVLQGYNGQALTDSEHQVIVFPEVFGTGQDHGLLETVINGAKQVMTSVGHDEDYFEDVEFSADSNYNDVPNLQTVNREGLDAYIPDNQFRRRDPRFAEAHRHKPKKSKKFHQSDFVYDVVTDSFTCPAGKQLNVKTKQANYDSGTERHYGANKSDCEACELREQCLHQKKARRRMLVVRTEVWQQLSNQIQLPLDGKDNSPAGNSSVQSEFDFGDNSEMSAAELNQLHAELEVAIDSFVDEEIKADILQAEFEAIVDAAFDSDIFPEQTMTLNEFYDDLHRETEATFSDVDMDVISFEQPEMIPDESYSDLPGEIEATFSDVDLASPAAPDEVESSPSTDESMIDLHAEIDSIVSQAFDDAYEAKRNLSLEMRNKIDTAKGREKYSYRMSVVEPVFANICFQKGMNLFTLRGKRKVNIQWILYCIVHNIEKIAHYGDWEKYVQEH